MAGFGTLSYVGAPACTLRLTHRMQTKPPSSTDTPPPNGAKPARRTTKRVTFANAVSGAALGTLLDNYHSQFDALRYKNPIDLPFGITTSWWTPILFALAAVIIGNGVLLVDGLLAPPREKPATAPEVLLVLALYSFQYYLSGLLHAAGISHGVSFLALSAYAFALWRIFDQSSATIVLGVLTAISGPLIEVALINITHAYEYTRPDLLGVPLWIFPVYFAGATAVGSLNRWFVDVL